MSRSARAYRLLLRAYPGATRDALGDDMAQLFADQVRDAGGSPLALAGVWIRALVDTARSAPGEHRSARKRQVAEGPVVGEPGLPLRGQVVLASLPSLLFLVLFIAAPGGPSPMGALEPPAIQSVTLVALAVAQWLAALKAVRAPTPGWKIMWALVCTACLFGLILGPALVLILTRLGWDLGL